VFFVATYYKLLQDPIRNCEHWSLALFYECIMNTIGRWLGYVVPSLVSALLYSLCIHKIGLRIYVHNFLSDFVTACSQSRQKTRVTNLLGKALQDNMHEMIDKNYEDNTKNVSLFVIDKGSYLQEKPPVNIYTLIHMHIVNK